MQRDFFQQFGLSGWVFSSRQNTQSVILDLSVLYNRIQLKNTGYLTGKISKNDKFRQNYLRHKNWKRLPDSKVFSKEKKLESPTKTKKELWQAPIKNIFYPPFLLVFPFANIVCRALCIYLVEHSIVFLLNTGMLLQKCY